MNDKFIKDLTCDLKPVTPLCTKTRFFYWALFLLIYSVGAIIFLGVRSDFADVSHTTSFWIDILELFLIIFLATKFTFKLCKPGTCCAMTYAFIFPLVLLVGKLLFVGEFGSFSSAISTSCMHHGTLLSIIPLTFLFYFSRGNYSTHPKMFVFLLAMSGTSVGVLLLHFLCSHSSPLHTLLSHVLPALGASFLIANVAKYLLKKL